VSKSKRTDHSPLADSCGLHQSNSGWTGPNRSGLYRPRHSA